MPLPQRVWSKVEVAAGSWQTSPQRRQLSATLLVHIEAGALSITLDGQAAAVHRAGALLWLPSGRAFTSQALGRTRHRLLRLRTGLWAGAAEADREAIGLMQALDARALRLGPALSVTSATSREIQQVLRDLAGIADPKRPVASPWSRCLLKSGAMRILAALALDARLDLASESMEHPDGRRADVTVGPALAQLDRQVVLARDDVTVAEMAAWCGLRPARFHACFLAATGLTPHRYLLERRVALACTRLRSSRDGLLGIGYACGFASPSRFYAAFRSVTGQSPGAWRDAARTETDLNNR